MTSRRWALVTGGSRGIGRAACHELAAQGWNITLVHLRNEEAAADTAAAVRAAGAECLVIRANLARPDECAAVIERTAREAGKLSGLVHAAGLGALAPALDTRPNRWQLAWETHVGSLLHLLSAARGVFASEASVVALSSLGSERVMPGYASIAAAKGGLETLVRYLAAELAPAGITVNCVRGGPVDTDSLRSFSSFGELQAESTRRPCGRLGVPSDLAPVIAFLLGPGARWIQGQVIVADGGFSLS